MIRLRDVSKLLAAPVAAVGLVLAVLPASGCGSPTPVSTSPAPEARPSQVILDEAGHPAGLHHHRRWSERIGQGAQPEGEVAFQNLAALGYRTLLSVDGVKPDAELAARHGLRYVHVPFGYDGIPADAAARIVKAVRVSEGPVYVHCHHGLHRGPAGAMIARIGVDGIDSEEAVREMKESGCSEKYKGLYRDILNFTPPAESVLSALPADLPSYVPPGDMAEHMVAVSYSFERMQAVEKAAWGAPADCPDVDPPHEARILWEGLREMQRLEAARGQGEEFVRWLAESEESARGLEESLRAGDHSSAKKALAAVKSSCDTCHAKYRN